MIYVQIVISDISYSPIPFKSASLIIPNAAHYKQLYWTLQRKHPIQSVFKSFYKVRIFYLPFVDVHLTVRKCTSYRRSLPIGSFTAAERQLYHRPVVTLPLPCGSATTGLWQSYHCPLNDGKVFNEKRNSLGLGMRMTKFVALHSLFTHSSVCKGKFLSIIFNVIPQYQANQWGNTRKSYW